MTTLILISILSLITIGAVLFIYRSSRSEYISDEEWQRHIDGEDL